MSNDLDPDQALCSEGVCSGFRLLCKGHQQMTKATNGRQGVDY